MKYQRAPVEAIRYQPQAERIPFVRQNEEEIARSAQRRENFEADAGVKEVSAFIKGTVGGKGQKNYVGMTAGWGRNVLELDRTDYLLSVETPNGTAFVQDGDWLIKDGKTITIMSDEEFKVRFSGG